MSARRHNTWPAPALGLSMGVDESRRSAVLRARGSAGTAQTVLAAVIVPMVAVTIVLALTSRHLQHPLATALYFGYLTATSMAIGLYWWVRRPASRFGPLLVVFGILAWVISWESSEWPLPFDLAVLTEAPYFVLTFYLFLAFPMGRLEPRAARWLMAALGVGAVGFFLPWALFSPVIEGGGPLTACGLRCPPNVLQVGSAPTLVDAAGHAETYVALAITIAVLVMYSVRVGNASRPQRRGLMAVAVTSLLFLPAWFISNFATWILKLDQGTLVVFQWVIVGTRVLLPLGFLVVLLQADRFAARALQDLLERLVGRPTTEQWNEMIVDALDDPSLRLGLYDPPAGRIREANGEYLTEPPRGSGRAWVPVDHDGRPVAAMVIDETLAENPELVSTAALATLLAVENGHLEGALRDSRARILEAAHAERRRIERNLHDSAQNRLVALRVRLALLGERSDQSEERAELELLGAEVDETIDELRALAHDVYPQVLAEFGITAALASTARRSAIPVSMHGAGLGRHSETVESTVYYCCLECLQNAAKHAGSGASVMIRLSDGEGRVRFSVEDDGVGFDPQAVERGTGLTNLADRIATVGGTLQIDTAPGGGTRIIGELPA